MRIVHEHWIFRHQGVGQIEAPDQLGIHIRLFHTQPDVPRPLRPRPLPPSRITRIITKVLSLLPLFNQLLPFPRPPRPSSRRQLRPPRRPAPHLRQIMRIIMGIPTGLGPAIGVAEAVEVVAVIAPNECQRPLAVEVLVLCQKCPSAVWIC